MKRLIYQVYVGNTNKLYDWCVQSVSNYCKKFDITHIVQREPILKILPDPTRQERNVGNWTKLGYLPIFEKENAFDLLKSHETNGEKFDMIILDPPSFTKNKKTLLDSSSSYFYYDFMIRSGLNPVIADDPCKLIKSQKNKTEIKIEDMIGARGTISVVKSF